MDDNPPLHLTTGRTEGDEPLLIVAGELDVATQSALRDALVELAAGGVDRVVVDLAAVSFIDSAGLNALLYARRAGAGLLVRNPSPRVRTLLELVGVPGILEVDDASAGEDRAAVDNSPS